MPADGSNRVWSGGPSFARQFVWVASSLDESWNTAAAAGQPVDTSNYRPNYFLLNGSTTTGSTSGR